MRRKLSSAMTPFYKFVFPVVIVAFCLNGAFDLGVQKGWPIILVMIVMLLGWYFFVGRLLVVQRDDTSLYVSNYRREIQIPLSDVTKVTENKLVNTAKRDDPSNPAIRVRIANHLHAGSAVLFVLPRPPVVAELSQSVALAREAETRNDRNGQGADCGSHRAVGRVECRIGRAVLRGAEACPAGRSSVPTEHPVSSLPVWMVKRWHAVELASTTGSPN
jgi:hypothetical protein